MHGPTLQNYEQMTDTSSEHLFTQNLLHKRKSRQPYLPSILFDDDDKRHIEGWSTKYESEDTPLTMLHTLSRNIKSYEKMQRKLSQKRNLKDMKQQLKNSRNIMTTRPQTTRRIKLLQKANEDNHTQTVLQNDQCQRSYQRKQKTEVIAQLLTQRKINSIRVIHQFDEIRELNQKKINNQRRITIHANQKSGSHHRSYIRQKHNQSSVSKHSKVVNQKLKRILCQKSNRSMVSPVFDLTVPLKQSQRLNEAQDFQPLIRSQRLSRKSRSPFILKHCNQNQFQDSRLFTFR